MIIDLEKEYVFEELYYLDCPIHNHKSTVIYDEKYIIKYKNCRDQIYINNKKIQNIFIFERNILFERSFEEIRIYNGLNYYGVLAVPISFYNSFIRNFKSNTIDNWFQRINLLK